MSDYAELEYWDGSKFTPLVTGEMITEKLFEKLSGLTTNYNSAMENSGNSKILVLDDNNNGENGIKYEESTMLSPKGHLVFRNHYVWYVYDGKTYPLYTDDNNTVYYISDVDTLDTAPEMVEEEDGDSVSKILGPISVHNVFTGTFSETKVNLLDYKRLTTETRNLKSTFGSSFSIDPDGESSYNTAAPGECEEIRFEKNTEITENEWEDRPLGWIKFGSDYVEIPATRIGSGSGSSNISIGVSNTDTIERSIEGGMIKPQVKNNSLQTHHMGDSVGTVFYGGTFDDDNDLAEKEGYDCVKIWIVPQ